MAPRKSRSDPQTGRSPSETDGTDESFAVAANAGHRKRLRARFLSGESMQDYEILELLLGYALPRRDTRLLAKRLLARFGGLDGFIQASSAELEALPGIGPGIACFCGLIREVLASCLVASASRTVRDAFHEPEEVMRFARLHLSGCPHEEVWIATLDSGNRLIKWERLHRGTVTRAPLYVRDAMEVALQRKAAGFVLVHNHPGGSPQPSAMDLETTREVARVARCLDIRLLDHLIVTDTGCYSMRQAGALDD